MNDAGVGPRTRRRALVLALLVVIVALGLASRVFAPALPTVLARYAGDTLWATAVFLTLAFGWPGASSSSLAMGATLFSLAVELSQLAHPAWLETVRGWPGAGLLLGYDFVWSDLACYALGVILGVLLDRRWLRHEHPAA